VAVSTVSAESFEKTRAAEKSTNEEKNRFITATKQEESKNLNEIFLSLQG